jgi:hypothetical protein
MKIRCTKKTARARWAALFVLALAICGTDHLSAAEWRIESVDPGGGGKFSSLKIDHAGNAHVAYYDEATHELKYGFRDRKLNKWFTTRLDITSGFCSLALDSKDRPHISYLVGNGKLSYIHWDDKSWVKETLAISAKVIDFYTSIALDTNNNPRISFYQYWGMGEDYDLHLRNIAWTGNRWEVQTIDSTPGSGKFNSLGIGSTGFPQVAYANVRDENASLRYAAWNGKTWLLTVLEGMTVRRPVQGVAMAIDKQGEPRIVYSDLTTSQIKYAASDKGKWSIQVVDTLVGAAYPDRNGIALDEEGHPYLTYFDAGSGVLKLAYQIGGRWATEMVDQNSNGFTSSVQIHDGNIWISYGDGSGATLHFAYRKLESSEKADTGQKDTANRR